MIETNVRSKAPHIRIRNLWRKPHPNSIDFAFAWILFYCAKISVLEPKKEVFAKSVSFLLQFKEFSRWDVLNALWRACSFISHNKSQNQIRYSLTFFFKLKEGVSTDLRDRTVKKIN